MPSRVTSGRDIPGKEIQDFAVAGERGEGGGFFLVGSAAANGKVPLLPSKSNKKYGISSFFQRIFKGELGGRLLSRGYGNNIQTRLLLLEKKL